MPTNAHLFTWFCETKNPIHLLITAHLGAYFKVKLHLIRATFRVRHSQFSFLKDFDNSYMNKNRLFSFAEQLLV